MTKHGHPPPSRSACMFAGGAGGQDGVDAWGGGGGVTPDPAGRERKLLRTCRRRSGAVVKHAAHKEKPVHLVQRRNARERRRVQAVNVAFSRLSKVVPLESRGKRISKVKTLHKAIEYIDHLRQLLAADDVSRGHVNGATLDSSGDKENSWCAPPQVYADDYYPPQPHAYSMQYTIMTDYTPGQ
ncbi:protein atonal homolog 7-like [Pollicipes pollicipes]|uniref:protein atonal homolog 7-like n=1 Tax=Pollicipes pollicipes TaxID=41117 RepID=UPI001884B6B6|nr:protein atonal homolog 7-like [Pollicipes pollicipes]